MSHYPSKRATIENKEKRKEINETMLLQAGTETATDPAIGHSQDSDRHHQVSHERLSKQRNDFEHEVKN